jgi:hypothetical protein
MCRYFFEYVAEICQKKVHFLEDLKTPKNRSEINWPLSDLFEKLEHP